MTKKLSTANMAVEICENSDSEDDKPLTIESVNLHQTLKHRQEIALVKERQNWPIIAIINGKQCQNVLLDHGASRTVLHKSLVSDADYLQEMSYIVSTNSAITVHLRARAKIEVGWRSEELEIAVQNNLMFDALIGADYPDIWELGKQLVHKELIALAQTRNTRKVNYKEVNSDVSYMLEDDIKEARTQEDQEQMSVGVIMRLRKEKMTMVHQLQSTVRVRSDKRMHPVSTKQNFTKMFSRKFRNRMQDYRRHWRRQSKEMMNMF